MNAAWCAHGVRMGAWSIWCVKLVILQLQCILRGKWRYKWDWILLSQFFTVSLLFFTNLLLFTTKTTDEPFILRYFLADHCVCSWNWKRPARFYLYRLVVTILQITFVIMVRKSSRQSTYSSLNFRLGLKCRLELSLDRQIIRLKWIIS